MRRTRRGGAAKTVMRRPCLPARECGPPAWQSAELVLEAVGAAPEAAALTEAAADWFGTLEAYTLDLAQVPDKDQPKYRGRGGAVVFKSVHLLPPRQIPAPKYVQQLQGLPLRARIWTMLKQMTVRLFSGLARRRTQAASDSLDVMCEPSLEPRGGCVVEPRSARNN